MITHEIAEKALEVYRRLCPGKKKPPRRGTKEYNRQVSCIATILEGVRPDIEEAHLDRLIAQAKGRIVPFRNPLTGTWTRKPDPRFITVGSVQPFKGARGEK
jgi:hypothetical protein